MSLRPPSLGSAIATRREHTFRYRGGTARTGSYRGRTDVGHLVVAGAAPPVETLRHAIRALETQGYREVMTAPVVASHAHRLEGVGFRPFERLHLLSAVPNRVVHGADLSRVVRRARAGDRQAILDVDGAAFEGFWRFGSRGLADALAATPRRKLFVSAPGDAIVAYAIVGSAGRAGYVQRLAVDPGHQGHGIGRDLLTSCLAWLRRRRVAQAFVNTQHGNHAALRLYETVGFRRHPSGLHILRRPLFPVPDRHS